MFNVILFSRTLVIPFLAIPIIPPNATWSQNGDPIGGELKRPHGLVIDDNQKILIADLGNHRVIQYNTNGTEEKVVAGGKGNGTRLDQLNEPRNFVVDKQNNSLIICDYGNRRVVRWSRENNTQQGEILLDNIRCWGLALDEQRNLYVPDVDQQQVRRYGLGDKNGTLVAGGNGNGSGLNQLDNPFYLFVDQEQNVYVSDNNNHRVMKWGRNAMEGIVIAGNKGRGNSSYQLGHPDGIFVDYDGTLYVAENDNHRVTRWFPGAQQGTVIVGGHGSGQRANQLNFPFGLFFDVLRHLYVADTENGRVQHFSIQ